MLREGVISGKQCPDSYLWVKMSELNLRLLSTSEEIKPEENSSCRMVVINNKGKIFLQAWIRNYFWMPF